MNELLPILGTMIAGFVSLIIQTQRTKAKQAKHDEVREGHFNDFVAEMREDHRHLKQKFEASEKANNELLNELDALRLELSNERKRFDLLTARQETAEAKHRQENAILEKTITELKAQSESLSKSLEQSVSEQEGLRERVRELENKVSALTEEKAKLLEELKTERDNKANMEVKYRDEITQLSVDKKVLETENKTLNRTITVLEKMQESSETKSPAPETNVVETPHGEQIGE